MQIIFFLLIAEHSRTVYVEMNGQVVSPTETLERFRISPDDTSIGPGDKKRGMAIPPKIKFTISAAKLFCDVAPEANDK